MQKINKSKISLIKVIVICLILFVLSGVGVMALATNLSTVKIELANGYEMTVLTSKNNIKEILNDNNIILKDNEKVIPSLEENLTFLSIIHHFKENTLDHNGYCRRT